ncbi:MAG: amidase [Proteobacteria bacterium]|nr:amidase [Pseudomonadota bacterium]
MDDARTDDLTRLSATRAAALIAAGQLTASALVEALLARIAAREPAVAAWVFLDPDQARAAARARDAERPAGPLHGVPIGIKDVIATADQPTACNSPIYAGHRPAEDAVCVQRLRAAGAIILGKTVTTEFAFVRPGPTRHPHDPSRTPGGSSSGSAAAVADFMVPAALGTQTGGSTIRPAAFCGLIGYKPAFGLFPTRGLKHLAPSLDTIGVMARDLDDVALLSRVLADTPDAPPAQAADPPPLALFATPYAAQAEPAAADRLADTARGAAAAGARVRTLEAPAWFGNLDPAHRVIMAVETARAFTQEWQTARDRLSRELAAFIAQGQRHTEDELAAALTVVSRARRWLIDTLAPDELILTFPAPGEAPLGHAATGNAVFNRLWTLVHVACLTVPAGVGPHGMPLGVQLVDVRSDEPRLLAAGRWLLRQLTG